MKKSLIALAVAGVVAAPAAMADTANVNIYGTIDMSYDFTNQGNGNSVKNLGAGNVAQNGVSAQKVSSNTSKLGFKGTEDLGDGLSAIWQIEQQINTDGGTAAGASGTVFATRNTFLGLKSNSMGTVLLGRHDTPYKLADRKLDVFADNVADNRTLMGGVSGKSGSASFGGSFDGRQANVIAYISPAMNNFTLALANVSLNETAGTTAPIIAPKMTAYSLAGMYDAAPFYGSLAYEAHDTGVAAANAATLAGSEKAWKLGAGYTMDAFNFSFAYEKTSDNFGGSAGAICAGAAAGTDCFGHSAYYLAGKYSFGNDAVKLAYTKSGDINGGGVAANKLNTAASQIALGYDHNLSKRTMVYAVYTALSNGNGSNFALTGQTTGGTNAFAAGGYGTKPSVFALGMKHSF